ncbi:RIP metalloprotease RseP, partial [Gemmatimonadota bacterium]
MTTILSTIIVLGILIFVHELGHFLAAKAAGVRVLTFSFGFGPRLFGFRRGETDYVVSAMPLGGYVKMAGDIDEMLGEEEVTKYAEQDYAPGDYMYASLPRRLAIITAGPAMNIVLAFVIYFGITLTNGLTRVETTEVGHFMGGSEFSRYAAEVGLRPGDRIVAVDGDEVSDWYGAIRALNQGIGATHALLLERDGERLSFEFPSLLASDGSLHPTLADSAGQLLEYGDTYGMLPAFGSTIGTVEESSAASRAGLEPGDKIVAVNGVPVDRYWQAVEVWRDSPGAPVEFTVERVGESVPLVAVPERRESEAGEPYGFLGVSQDVTDLPIRTVRLGLAGAIGQGASETWQQGTLVLRIVGGLISGQISLRKSIGGPVMIAKVAGESARGGLVALLLFIAFLSVNLGVLNLMPIPVLDGGHLVFLSAEAIRGGASRAAQGPA